MLRSIFRYCPSRRFREETRANSPRARPQRALPESDMPRIGRC
jgi:hypothetical protein